jgi:signal transduction histidine kinase
LSIVDHLKQLRAYLSRRLWILGGLLLLLCVLGVVQYRWINQVAEAQRQRAKSELATALSDLESDFDIEITRAFAIFQRPTTNLGDYAERYQQWLRLAPYPGLLHGVYILDSEDPGSSPKPLIPGEPPIPAGQWDRDIEKQPSAVFVVTAPGVDTPGSFHVVSEARAATFMRRSKPAVVIDGNPGFVFPVVPVFSTFAIAGRPGSSVWFHGINLFQRGGGRTSRPLLGLVVLDATYIKTVFLPRMVKLHFPQVSPDYDIFVVEQTVGQRSKVVYGSESVLPPDSLAQSDGNINLFRLRLDCFLPSTPPSGRQLIQTVSGPGVMAKGQLLSEVFNRRPSACGNAGPASGVNSEGLWQLVARYRAGSLDQAFESFRRRNILLGGSVLLVLASGMLALLFSTERARALAQMQTEFVLGVSHEFRTPITVIRLAADNLMSGMVENSQQARTYGEIIGTHASELSNMVEETLAFARLESKDCLPDSTPISPAEVVKTSLVNCARALEDAGMKVELNLAPDLPLVDVDVRLLSRCLENLILNATKYAASGQWVGVRVRNVNRAEGERVQILVEDRGPGISALDLPRVFEPFFRGSQDHVSKAPGVGLGLTLVKRVMERHHGTVEVVSVQGAGASFSLFLVPHRVQQDFAERCDT